MTTTTTTGTTGTTLITRVTRVRDELAARRERREATRTLRRELACYTTLDDINDLLAAADRDDSGSAEQVRTILVQNLARLAS